MSDLSYDSSTVTRMRQVWLEHPVRGVDPGFSQTQTSKVYERYGFTADERRNIAKHMGKSVIKRYGIRNQRWRGDGSGTGAWAERVRQWIEETRHAEELQAALDIQDRLLSEVAGLDGRYRREGMLTIRLGQRDFRDLLLRVYERRCWISGCEIERVVQAAHIEPHSGKNNFASNGMLLRADLSQSIRFRTLVDRAGS